MTGSGEQHSLLVIEDNPGDYFLIEDYLSDVLPKAKLQKAISLSEASDFLNDLSRDFDLILLDLGLPDKSGEELIRDILKMAHDTPVVALTGYSDIEFSIRSLSLGISDYLLKDELTPTILYKSILYNIERKKNSLALKESEKRYSELFHLSPLPMFVFNLDTYEFLDVNRAAEKHYGYTREEFLQIDLFDLKPEEERESLIENVERSKNKKEEVHAGVFNHITKAGEWIKVEVKFSNLEFRGKPAQLLLANDVTERFKYIEAIRGQNKKLREIAWTHSHEVRAPLARLMTLVDFMNYAEDSDLSEEDLRKEVMKSAKELDEIIHRITAKTEELDIDDLEAE